MAGLRWWGLETNAATLPCQRAANDFEIAFHADDTGLPGAQLAAVTVSPDRLNTGDLVSGESDFPLFRYDAVFDPPINVPAGWLRIRSTGDVNFCGFSWSLARDGEGDGAAARKSDGDLDYLPVAADFAFCMIPGENAAHSADQNGDNAITLSELLRVIQFYNSGALHCAGNPGDTEDGFVPGAGANQGCTPHSSDYNPQNWTITLSELLRLIQFYNSGAFHPCPEGEDGYCPGPA